MQLSRHHLGQPTLHPASSKPKLLQAVYSWRAGSYHCRVDQRTSTRQLHKWQVRSQPNGHPDWPRNRERYEGLRDEDVLELESFLQLFRQKQGEASSFENEGPGEVHLVGTGPGDPGLLTLRAVQLMQTADVVLYDRLVSDDILNLVGPQARMVYVGKHSGFHTRSQEEIHALLLAFAEAGATVIRLKGGDPYVFGRGGEEVQYLAARGITVHCVPGITAASGISAEIGVPLTHRGVATSVRFLTGHARDGGEQELLDSTVAGAADPHTTLVVYMGLQSLPKLYAQLSQHGMPSDVPAMAVERGTTPRQRVVFGPVGELPALTQAAGLKSPTLIIIGQVVALAPGWQQWQQAGKPLVWKGTPPRHGHRLPTVDMQQLQQASTLTTAYASQDEGIKTRTVLPSHTPAVFPATSASGVSSTNTAVADAPVIPSIDLTSDVMPTRGSVPPHPIVFSSTVQPSQPTNTTLQPEQHPQAQQAAQATAQAVPSTNQSVERSKEQQQQQQRQQQPVDIKQLEESKRLEMLDEDPEDEGECEGEMCEMDWGEDDDEPTDPNVSEETQGEVAEQAEHSVASSGFTCGDDVACELPLASKD